MANFKYKGAGVLPYYMDDEGKLFVYLAKRINHPDKGRWSFYGGAAKDGESFLDAARREFFEESGFRADARELLEFWNSNLLVFEYHVFAYRCKAMNPMSYESEFSEAKWFSIDNVPSKDRSIFLNVELEVFKKLFTVQ